MLKKKRRRELEIYIAILQNGVKIADRSFLNTKDFAVTFSRKKNSKYRMWIPCYHFYDEERPFIECRNGLVFLHRLLGGTGIGTSRGQSVKIEDRFRDDSTLELELDDYISYSVKDLRILVKIMLRSKTQEPPRESKSPQYRLSILRAFFADTRDALTFIPSTTISAILVGSVVGGLYFNRFERPKDIRDIPQEYVLPFISQRYLNLSPELLKENLDVNNISDNIISYNQEAVETLLGNHSKGTLLPLVTRRDYHSIFQDQLGREAQAIEVQKSADVFQINSSHSRLVVVPTVKRETLRGSIDRVLDKVELILQGAEESLKLRREILEEFKSDSPHIYEEYQNIEESTQKNDALKKIKPWSQLTTEEQLYTQVEELSKQGASNIIASQGDSEPYFPIGILPGSNFLTFIVDDPFSLDFPLDSKINGAPLTLVENRAEKRVQAKDGTIDPSKIENFIKIHKYQLQICYEIALRTDDQSEGSMEWKWKVDQTGRIFDVSLIAANINNEKMIRCIREKISQWKFPAPQGGVIEISFPFEFSPSKG